MQDLTAYLGEFLTENRKMRIEQVLENRLASPVLVLEDPHDPHNAAACLRSADAFGIQYIHIIENKNKFQVKEGVSLGSAGWLDIQRWTSTEECFVQLKSEGFKIAVTTPGTDAVAVDSINTDQPLALVMGSEHDGISRTAAELADYTVTIPMYGFAESFNLSVSAALTLSAVTGKLRHRKDYSRHILSEKKKNEIRLRWYKKNIRSVEGIIQRYYDTHSNR